MGFKIRAAMLMALLAVRATSTQATAFVDGNILIELCTASGEWAAHSCESYIVGVLDTYEDLIQSGEVRAICLPDGARSKQLSLVVSKYLKEHPENLHFRASSLVSEALFTAFPCPGPD